MATTRKASKERTRNRLVQATLKVLYKHGLGALTTGRIAEAAGVAQPTFYVHFQDMDDAMRQAADAVANKLSLKVESQRVHHAPDPGQGSADVTVAAIVRGLLEEPRLAELFLRHRRDVGTPIGSTWRGLQDRFRAALAEDLQADGFDGSDEALAIQVEALLGSALAMVEAILDKRVPDADRAISQLTGGGYDQVAETTSTRSITVA